MAAASSTPELRRPQHRAVAAVLHALDRRFLDEAHCYFGGGTCVSLLLDEFRLSRDVDFLCSDRDGIRRLRSGREQQREGEEGQEAAHAPIVWTVRGAGTPRRSSAEELDASDVGGSLGPRIERMERMERGRRA